MPKEPFPSIKGCVHHPPEQPGHGFCTINSISTTEEVSCFVNEYYPSITLSFRHNSLGVAFVENGPSTNSDGTKNKSVTARVDISDQPYECVATDIPGSEPSLERSSEFYVTRSAAYSPSTTPHRVTQNEGTNSVERNNMLYSTTSEYPT